MCKQIFDADLFYSGTAKNQIYYQHKKPMVVKQAIFVRAGDCPSVSQVFFKIIKKIKQ